MSARYPDRFVAVLPLDEPMPPAELRRHAQREVGRMTAALGCTFAAASEWTLHVGQHPEGKQVTVIAPVRSTRPRQALEREARAFIRDVAPFAPGLSARCDEHMTTGEAL